MDKILTDKARDIVCHSCNTVSSADTCEWRIKGEYCSVPDELLNNLREFFSRPVLDEGKIREIVDDALVREAIICLGKNIVDEANHWTDMQIQSNYELRQEIVQSILSSARSEEQVRKEALSELKENAYAVDKLPAVMGGQNEYYQVNDWKKDRYPARIEITLTPKDYEKIFGESLKDSKEK